MRPHCLRSRSDYFWTFALNLSLKFSITKRRIYFQGRTPVIESLLISYHQLNTPPVIDWKIHRPEAKPCQSGRRSSLFVWFSQKRLYFEFFSFALLPKSWNHWTVLAAQSNICVSRCPWNSDGIMAELLKRTRILLTTRKYSWTFLNNEKRTHKNV